MIAKLNLFKNLIMDHNNSFYSYLTPEHELIVRSKSCTTCKHKLMCFRFISNKSMGLYKDMKPNGCFNFHRSDDDVYIFIEYNSMKHQLLMGKYIDEILM